MNVFLDLETIPDQSEGAIEKIAKNITVSVPSDLTKPKLMEAIGTDDKYKTVPELKEIWLDMFGQDQKMIQAKDKWLKTSFDGGYGEIICIGFELNHGAECLHGDEKRILKSFWDYISDELNGRNPFFIAHNAKFDLPFLWKRSVINNIAVPSGFNPHGRHGTSHYCTMEAWAGYGNRISLDSLSKILDCESKTEGMSGDQVWPEFQSGNIEKIADYCKQDVNVLRQVYNKMNFNNQ